MRMMPIYPFMRMPAYPDYNIPPTLYSIMESMANFGKEDKVKIKDLALATHERIFDFTYPLSDKVDKVEFECMILNHFLERRIGRETMTAFKIALNVKLNEIMPIYNKMFDMLDGWDLFNDGEVVYESGSNYLDSTTDSSNTSDRRYSDTPQDELENIRDGKYVSDYNYDTDTGLVNSKSSGTDTRKIQRSPSDKIKIYKEFMDNQKAIYTMIFDSLDPLFYGLV